ncbi:hypothetical protein AgCh_017587 [Apium graveolens]
MSRQVPATAFHKSKTLDNKYGLVKLADFGVATKLTEANINTYSVVGTPYWMAPEVIEMSGVCVASDIWSVGCTVIELLTCSPPYYDLQPMPALFRIVQMTYDRSWVGHNRYNDLKYLTEEYKNGVDDFIKFACDHLDPRDGGLIRCPCNDCVNKYFKDPSAVKVDLYLNGIMEWYTRWDLHGERDMPRGDTNTSSHNIHYNDEDMYDARDMLRDFADANRHFENFVEEPNAKAKEFYEMVENASEPIYPNNPNFTTLSFVNKLLHWKHKHNCTNSGFDELIHLIGSVLPVDHKLPRNYYDVRKMIRGLHMEYEKIDACENDCMLFYKENRNKTHCDICTTSRYKEQKDSKKNKIP